MARPGSRGHLTILPSESEPLWEQPHLLRCPRCDPDVFECQLYFYISFSPRKLLLSSHEFVQLVTRTPLKPSPSEIRQRTQLKLRPQSPFRKHQCNTRDPSYLGMAPNTFPTGGRRQDEKGKAISMRRARLRDPESEGPRTNRSRC